MKSCLVLGHRAIHGRIRSIEEGAVLQQFERIPYQDRAGLLNLIGAWQAGFAYVRQAVSNACSVNRVSQGVQISGRHFLPDE